MNLFMGLITDPFSAGRGVANNGPTAFADDSESMAYAGRAKSKNPNDAFAAFTKHRPPLSSRNAGTCGRRATVVRRPPMAMQWLVRTTPPALSMAARPVRITGSRRIRSQASRSPAAAATSVWRTVVGPLGHVPGRRVRASQFRCDVSDCCSRLWLAGCDDGSLCHRRRRRSPARNFNANAYSGRLEFGHRFLTPWFGGLGVSPYAAAQITAFELPSYAERAITGASTFALNCGAETPPRHRAPNSVCARINPTRSMAQCSTLRGRARVGARLQSDQRDRCNLPDAARRIVRGERRGACVRLRADNGVRRSALAQRLVRRWDRSKVSSPTSPAATPARAWCVTTVRLRKMGRTGWMLEDEDAWR